MACPAVAAPVHQEAVTPPQPASSDDEPALRGSDAPEFKQVQELVK